MNERGIGSVSRRRLLDTYGLLALLNKEPGFEKVREVLRAAQKCAHAVRMNEINVGETYYIVLRNRGRERADCFAVATARRGEAIILTGGDPEFKKIKHLAEIEWLT